MNPGDQPELNPPVRDPLSGPIDPAIVEAANKVRHRVISRGWGYFLTPHDGGADILCANEPELLREIARIRRALAPSLPATAQAAG